MDDDCLKGRKGSDNSSGLNTTPAHDNVTVTDASVHKISFCSSIKQKKTKYVYVYAGEIVLNRETKKAKLK